MSFLAGRLAAKEGSYFLQTSKHAAGRLAEKLPSSAPGAAAAARRRSRRPTCSRRSSATPCQSGRRLLRGSLRSPLLLAGPSLGAAPRPPACPLTRSTRSARTSLSLKRPSAPKDGSFQMNSLITLPQQPMSGSVIGTHLPWTLKS